MSAKKSTKQSALVQSPIANLPLLVKEVKAEAERIRKPKKKNKKKGYWMKTNDRVYKM